MVQLGLSLVGVATALDLEEGLAFLDKMLEGQETPALSSIRVAKDVRDQGSTSSRRVRLRYRRRPAERT
jgi:hypothetical protein